MKRREFLLIVRRISLVWNANEDMKVKKALGIISKHFKEPQKCESCGEDFTCGANLKGCWCFEIDVSDNAREELKSKFKECLCRKCLENFEASVS